VIDTTLINYFFGKAILLVFAIIGIYALIKLYNKYSKLLDYQMDSELKQKVLEDLMLIKIAKDRGIDLKKELKKYEEPRKNRRFISEIVAEELKKVKEDTK